MNKEYQAKWQKENPEKCRTYTYRWREKNKEHYSAVNKEWREKNREKQTAYMRQWREKNRAGWNAYMADFRFKRRKHVIEHYGGKCACCGEMQFEFLSLDHKDGGGTKHRKEVLARGGEMINWIIRNDFPPIFRVLCYNCNSALGFLGYCPHQREE